jgi:group I intron endonuclease
MTTNMYSKGKIYRLVNSVDNEFYVGSTCDALHKRLYNHKAMSKHRPNYCVYQHFNNIGWDNVRIVLVEEYPCETKYQLERRERHFIELMKPKLNKFIPTRTNKEWRENNKETLTKKNNEWRENNKERYKEKQREYRDKNKQERKQKRKEWYEQNKDNIKKKYEQNKEEINAKHREKYAENKETINARRRERSAVKKSAITEETHST